MKQQVQRDDKKAPKVKREVVSFQPFWNNKDGKFDNATDYVLSFGERTGFARGAKIKQ